ncbi:WxL domain-containing protein [Virgibacillus xinjiangensis]|uniref:WxL domain-containing protein n=1 Tax=Virgibacillus xinjiangensis TaxID=393090 RepID=A0ABV7CW98_9BACI
MNKLVKKFAVGTLAVGLAAGAFAPSALAASQDVESTITGGTLSLDAPTIQTFSGVELNGAIQTSTASIDEFTVKDARGSGEGWKLSVSSTQLTNGTNTLPAGSLKITEPTLTAGEGSDDLSTVNVLSGAIDNESGVKLLSAETDGGMGTYTVSGSNLNINLQPKDAKAGTYSSTVTFNLTTGP